MPETHTPTLWWPRPATPHSVTLKSAQERTYNTIPLIQLIRYNYPPKHTEPCTHPSLKNICFFFFLDSQIFFYWGNGFLGGRPGALTAWLVHCHCLQNPVASSHLEAPEGWRRVPYAALQRCHLLERPGPLWLGPVALLSDW